MTLFSVARAEALREAIFRRSVDLTGRHGLYSAPAFKNRIADDLIYVS